MPHLSLRVRFTGTGELTSQAKMKSKSSHVLQLARLLLSLFVSNVVFAEGGCPPGQYPQQGQGWKTCVPIPGAQTEQAVQPPPPSFASRWGAVASSSNAVYGIVTDQTDKALAEQSAIAECISRGGDQCKLNYTYSNQCVAVIGVPNRTSLAVPGKTEADATRSGMDKCSADGIAGCWVYYSGCSMPVRVQ